MYSTLYYNKVTPNTGYRKIIVNILIVNLLIVNILIVSKLSVLSRSTFDIVIF